MTGVNKTYCIIPTPGLSLLGILSIKFSKSACVGIAPVLNRALICASVISLKLLEIK